MQRLVVFLIAVLVAAPSAPVPPPSEPMSPQQGTAIIKGSVKIKGDIPKRRKVRIEGDPKCAALHKGAEYLSDELVTDPAGNVQHAFVYVKKGLEEKTFEVPKKQATLEQRMCRFEPHVLGIQMGQELMIRNFDAMMHIIHAVPAPGSNKEWGFSQDKIKEERTKVFDKPEIMVPIRCDVHPWMSAFVGVVNHPYFAVSGPDGKFQIKGLPGGTYTLEVWHEKYAPVELEVEVKDKGTASADFALTTPKK